MTSSENVSVAKTMEKMAISIIFTRTKRWWYIDMDNSVHVSLCSSSFHMRCMIHTLDFHNFIVLAVIAAPIKHLWTNQLPYSICYGTPWICIHHSFFFSLYLSRIEYIQFVRLSEYASNVQSAVKQFLRSIYRFTSFMRFTEGALQCTQNDIMIFEIIGQTIEIFQKSKVLRSHASHDLHMHAHAHITQTQ